MVTRIKSINPIQLAVVSAVMYAFIGVILAVLLLPFMALMAAVGGSAYGHGNPMAGMGIFSLIIFPIMYGVLGFIGGIISALVYNVVAGWTGGIEMTFSQVGTMETVPATV